MDKQPRGFDNASVDDGDSSADEDISEGALRRKLVEESDEEDAVQAGVDQQDGSDVDSDEL